ncbi:type II toxin-antitoxin system VapC family toxin [Pyrofollis japonicus]|uniref:type II toxin-antitoxin system VapC family toxin n=1 Tax=Pyrofollis japonicus TaxID=3060460 RepID=UPI00295B074C|nr:type II toxin-antitoxin system VapC family toxin [Pyrofollis japonicus]BEP17307.1 type II toxin-antitoxin system VapC family toxin [Pyrofollis japonicus]
MRLLDTSVLIDNVRKGVFEEGAISVITLIEFLRGVDPRKRQRVKELLENSYIVLGIDNKVILEYCRLYDELRKRGNLLPDADLLIAATAIANNALLVTMDKDFLRLRDLGLRLELRL